MKHPAETGDFTESVRPRGGTLPSRVIRRVMLRCLPWMTTCAGWTGNRDCLLDPAQKEWPSPANTMANAAAWAIGGVTGQSVPRIAGLLLERVRVPASDRSDFLALRLLLGLTFPDGPLPDGAAFTDLSDPQQKVVRGVLQSGLLKQGVMIRRAIGECNLPNTEKALASWYAERPRSPDG